MSDHELARGMASLAAGLREVLPDSDAWQVEVIDLLNGQDAEPWLMVSVTTRRIIDGEPLTLKQSISPAMLTAARDPRWVGQLMGERWQGRAAEVLANRLTGK